MQPCYRFFMAFTAKQSVFIKEYLVDMNATQAAIRAGYSKKTANRIASELMSKPDIQQAVKAEMEARSRSTDLSIERVLLEYKRLALFDIRNLYKEDGSMKDIHDLDEDTAAALTSIESDDLYDMDGKKIGKVRKLKAADKRAALCDVMRHLGGFEKDNAQQNGAKPIIIADIKDLTAEQKMKALQSLL